MPLITPAGQIAFALKAIGVGGVGQTPLPEDSQDAFDALNGMIGLWNRRRWLIYHLVDAVATMTGAMSYTIGPGGDFNFPRPDRLEAAFFRQLINSPQGNIDYPLDIIQSREQYNLIALKTLSTTLPLGVFYDSAVPYGVVYPWPVPLLGQGELHLSIKDTIAPFTSNNQSINLPPEYTETIWTNLALRLAAIYPGSVVTDTIKGLARSSLETIRGANAQVTPLTMPAELRPNAGLYNIFSDQVGIGTG